MKRSYILYDSLLRFTTPILVAAACLLAGCTSYNKNSEGLQYFSQARYQEAMLAFQAALSAEPENVDTLYNIGATYYQSAKISLQSGQIAVSQQQFDEAEKYYRLCLSKDANHTAAYRGLAVLYMDRQQPDAAFNLLLGWEQANPVSPEPKIELARLYQEWAQICMLQGRTADAQSCQDVAVTKLQHVLATDPNNFRALRAMGYLKEQSGDIVNAIADYRRSLQANAKQKDLEYRIAALEQGGGYSATPSYVPGTSSGATVYGSGSSSLPTSDFGRSPF